MKTERVRGVWYRAIPPAYAHEPLSGRGSSAHGGRFNRPGVEALYLAADVAGAWAEANQGMAYAGRPKTLVAYEVDCDAILNLTDTKVLSDLGVTDAELSDAWRMTKARGQTPATWRLADQLSEKGVAGLIYPSCASGARVNASNLVLYRWSDQLPQRVVAFDPEAELRRRRTPDET